ncbi:MAG: hypothetical protein R3272_16250 [Candidatus Promineifilaceae bacterium]|nr:hypothetical protein [Candidatus Promineifilaceae bacterium]
MSKQNWARPVRRMTVGAVPDGALNMNVEGREPASPLQGFGPLWQRTFRIRLRGVPATPAEVMSVWKAEFPSFQPAGNRFHAPVAGVQAGEIIFLESAISIVPGRLPGVPIASGVRVVYVDDVCFTIMTPQGFPEAGFNTFSTFAEDGVTWAQVQTMARTSDPIIEFGYRFMGGFRFQRETWTHVLTALAARFGVLDEQVELNDRCVDPRLQWKETKNLWHNAMLRSMVQLPLHAVARGRGRAHGRRKK